MHIYRSFSQCRARVDGFLLLKSTRPHSPSFFSTSAVSRSPLNVVHDTLTFLHDVSSIPWIYLIPSTTVLLSLITLPLSIKSRKNTIKIHALQPLITAQQSDIASSVRRRLRASPTNNNHDSHAEFNREVARAARRYRTSLFRRHGVNVLALLSVPALKIPIWMTYSLTLRAMSGSHVTLFNWSPASSIPATPSFQCEGISWILNLTQVDHLLVLPFLFGLVTMMNVELNSGHVKGRLGMIVERGMRVMSVLLIPISAQMPAAVCLYWVSSSCIAVCQNVWLDYRYPVPKNKVVEDGGEGDRGQVVERLELPGSDEPIDAHKEASSSSSGGRK